MSSIVKVWMLGVAFVASVTVAFALDAKDVPTSASFAGVVRHWTQYLSSGAPLHLHEALRSLRVPGAEIDGQQARIIAAVTQEGLKARPGYAEDWHFQGDESVLAISFGVKPGTRLVASISVQFDARSCVPLNQLLKSTSHLLSRPAGGDGTQAWSYTDLFRHGTYSVLSSKRMAEPGACAQSLTFTFDNV